MPPRWMAPAWRSCHSSLRMGSSRSTSSSPMTPLISTLRSFLALISLPYIFDIDSPLFFGARRELLRACQLVRSPTRINLLSTEFHVKLTYGNGEPFSVLEGLHAQITLPKSFTDLSIDPEAFSHHPSPSKSDPELIDHTWVSTSTIGISPDGVDITRFVDLLRRDGVRCTPLNLQLIDYYR